MPGRSPASERPGVYAAVLSKCVRGKRDESDCDPEDHAIILRPIELVVPIGPGIAVREQTVLRLKVSPKPA
jgi:hypothetical protein